MGAFYVLWLLVNFFFPLQGISYGFVKAIKEYEQYIIALLFVLANMAFYILVAKLSQLVKKMKEKHCKRDIEEEF